ncbi:MAG: zinc-ribbon domain-containing protein, partial [Gemmataceae bacterium]|nr:zinc-ribbon domain-containing protein [Gemmataceae bacterium]
MAVELRCPDCRAKLRLPEPPEPGTEVECPKCGTAFAAPEPDDDPKPKKKPARDEDDGEGKPRKKDRDKGDGEGDKPKKKPAAKDKDAKGPRKRKAKKKETSNTLLIVVVGAGLLLLAAVVGVVVWFLGRTSKSVEMMYYLPEETEVVGGLNLGHAQKYPELYKSLSGSFGGTEFKAAGDALATALGAKDGDELMDYVVCGNGKSGATPVAATVIRTKTEFDQGALAKLPGAKAQNAAGKSYYTANGFKGGGRVKVFAPTNRLIVYCPDNTPDPVFQKMLDGNQSTRDKTIGVRAAALGKRTTRGTFWILAMSEGAMRAGVAPGTPVTPPTPTGGAGGEDGKAQFEKVKAETLSGAKG